MNYGTDLNAIQSWLNTGIDYPATDDDLIGAPVGHSLANTAGNYDLNAGYSIQGSSFEQFGPVSSGVGYWDDASLNKTVSSSGGGQVSATENWSHSIGDDQWSTNSSDGLWESSYHLNQMTVQGDDYFSSGPSGTFSDLSNIMTAENLDQFQFGPLMVSNETDTTKTSSSYSGVTPNTVYGGSWNSSAVTVTNEFTAPNMESRDESTVISSASNWFDLNTANDTLSIGSTNYFDKSSFELLSTPGSTFTENTDVGHSGTTSDVVNSLGADLNQTTSDAWRTMSESATILLPNGGTMETSCSFSSHVDVTTNNSPTPVITGGKD